MLEPAGMLLTDMGYYYVEIPFIEHRVTFTYGVLFNGDPKFRIRTRISSSVLPHFWGAVSQSEDFTSVRLRIKLNLMLKFKAQGKTQPNAESKMC